MASVERKVSNEIENASTSMSIDESCSTIIGNLSINNTHSLNYNVSANRSCPANAHNRLLKPRDYSALKFSEPCKGTTFVSVSNAKESSTEFLDKLNKVLINLKGVVTKLIKSPNASSTEEQLELTLCIENSSGMQVYKELRDIVAKIVGDNLKLSDITSNTVNQQHAKTMKVLLVPHAYKEAFLEKLQAHFHNTRIGEARADKTDKMLF